MKKYILYILFFAASFIPAKGFTQLCGEGTLTFNIYTLNGTETREFDYEIFPVSQALLEKNYYDKVTGKDEAKRSELITEIWRTGIEISFGLAAEIIDTADTTLIKELNQCLERSSIRKKGKIKSSLIFQTRETFGFPMILKISHNKKNIYILGDYFGGCDREASLLWTDSGVKLK